MPEGNKGWAEVGTLIIVASPWQGILVNFELNVDQT